MWKPKSDVGPKASSDVCILLDALSAASNWCSLCRCILKSSTIGISDQSIAYASSYRFVKLKKMVWPSSNIFVEHS